ncbi:penicillin-binding protein [Aspergillus eucalypticola CBS 122712]|uniref:Penicillin-binding protein n=1 Tax=Aspergillus eucalypticola (strain CBS 122712 / IBT 29274) TaxID=1448314 RepID=A0A317VEH6_ASPEC|nr:penicillin-binding protein [Aspergillus eucalypticola CBS 122712]PWY72783.1 penicillin-binding protein [Aspergillus eucalypticola CBS 122712]
MATDNTTASPLDEQFKTLVQETLDHWHVPGISIAVVDGDNTWAKAGGYGIAAFPAEPVTPSTLFYAGSTTKAFTAALMATIVEDNDTYPQVHWDTPISQLIRDDFVLHDEHATEHTTIEDALSHRSGLPRHDQAYGNRLTRDEAVRTIVRQLRHLPLTAPPRTKLQYCNLMYVVVSHVIETLTGGKWLGDTLTRTIWHPLGMKSTYFNLNDAKASPHHLARGYYHTPSDGDNDNDSNHYHEIPWMPLDEISGAGSIISNVVDYAKWARALLYQTEPLSPAVYKAIFEPRTLLPSEEPFTGPRAYALGWYTGVYQGVQFFEHTGGMNAFGAEVILFPRLKYAVVMLANTARTSNYAQKALAFRLVDEKLGVPVERRFDWNAKNMAHIEEERKKALDAIHKAPAHVIPHSLELGEYVGTYVHPGYQTVEIYLDQSKNILRADRDRTTWPEYLSFKHVNGEHFLAISEHVGDLGALFPDVYAAEFRIGEKGKPCALGVAWEKTMKEKIWFTRLD